MATKHEVTSISRTLAPNGLEMISHIGGNGNESRSWKISHQEAIAGIENHIWEFFVKQGSKTHNLIVCISPLGTKCLKIEEGITSPTFVLVKEYLIKTRYKKKSYWSIG